MNRNTKIITVAPEYQAQPFFCLILKPIIMSKKVEKIVSTEKNGKNFSVVFREKKENTNDLRKIKLENLYEMLYNHRKTENCIKICVECEIILDRIFLLQSDIERNKKSWQNEFSQLMDIYGK